MGGKYSRTILLVGGIIVLVIVLKIMAIFQSKNTLPATGQQTSSEQKG